MRAIVLGGSGGIGRAICQELASIGASLMIGARGRKALEAVSQDLRPLNRHISIETCDVGNSASVRHFVDYSVEVLGGLDLLVNCASSFSTRNDEIGWADSYQTDLMGAVRATNAAVPHLKDGVRPSIVHLSSVGARLAHPDRLPYGALKAALEQYTASSARLYASDGIRVNCVVPGSTFFEGGVWDRIRSATPDLFEKVKAGIPLGDLAKPCHIADAVMFLASDKASWITGQCLVVDGGQTIAFT
jgi:3-oxoacyl-[acyl-carrier protein] reductase